MDRILARLERRLGRFAIPHLTMLIVGGMGVVYVLSLLRPSFLSLLDLDLDLVKRGQVWRLVTYLFLPESRSMIFVLLALYFFWMVGTRLESEWGSFKLNVYYFLGMVGTTVAAAITGDAVGNTFLNMSLYLAFATVFPDFQIFLLVFPIRVKWLGIFFALMLGYEVVVGSWPTRAAVFAAMTNYLIFFGGHLVGLLKSRNVQIRQEARRTAMRSSMPPAGPANVRTCAICGASEDDGADIRVCSCEKCGGKPRTLCLAHARNH